jgi:hypothetical protein
MIEGWVRDGTIVSSSGTEIDIRCDEDGETWITVKSNDIKAERIAALVLAAPKMLKALEELLREGQVPAPGPHWRWHDEHYAAFSTARALVLDMSLELGRRP